MIAVDIGELVLKSLPFAVAAVLQAISPYIENHAKEAFAKERRVKVSDGAEEAAVRATTVTFLKVQLLFGLLISVASSLAFTAESAYPYLVAVPGVVFVAMIALWAMLWQYFDYDKFNGRPGRAARIAGWMQLILLWVITLYAAVLPARAA